MVFTIINNVVDATKEEDCLLACYAFLSSNNLYEKESFMPGECRENSGAIECFMTEGKVYKDTNVPPLNEFLQEYKKRRKGIISIGALDKSDTKRISMSYIPILSNGLVEKLLINDFDFFTNTDRERFCSNLSDSVETLRRQNKELLNNFNKEL